MENSNRTPVRENKRGARRKLASSRGAKVKVKPICPVSKRARVESSSDQVVDLTDNARNAEVDNGSASRVRTFSQCTPQKEVPTQHEDGLLPLDMVEALSPYDQCSQDASSFLPRITWQAQPISSPLQPDKMHGSWDGTVEADLPQAPSASTPYLERIWRSAKAKERASTQGNLFSGAASTTGAKSNSVCETKGEDTEKKASNAAWLKEMFSLVDQLEGRKSTSPSPETVRHSSSPAAKTFTRLLSRCSPLTASPAPHTIDTPPDSSHATANGSPLNLPISTLRKPSATQSAVKMESNSSMFSDSMGDFTSDFTLSDAELDDKTSSQKLSQLTEQLRSEIALSQSDANTHKPDQSAKQITGNVVTFTPNTVERVSADKSIVKPEPKTPESVTGAVKREPRSFAVKKEAHTPPNLTNVTSSRLRAKRGSPGTPLRRYSSHDSVIKSPIPIQPAQSTTQTNDSSNSTTNNNEKAILSTIEEKRKNALNKLRNRRSREGSFIRHKSLDSATIALSQTRTANEVSAANNSANQTLEQLINEKRKQAAEKLQRRRETDEKRERNDSLSGTIRQLTPPSSQDKSTSSSTSAATKPDTSQSDTKTYTTSSDTEPVSKDSITQSIDPAVTTLNKEKTVASQRCKGDDCPLTQPCSQSNSLSLDSMLEDMETTADAIPVRKPSPTKAGKLKFKSISKSGVIPATGQTDSRVQTHNLSQLGDRNQVNSDHKQNNVSEEERVKQLIEQKRLAALAKRKQSKLN